MSSIFPYPFPWPCPFPYISYPIKQRERERVFCQIKFNDRNNKLLAVLCYPFHPCPCLKSKREESLVLSNYVPPLFTDHRKQSHLTAWHANYQWQEPTFVNSQEKLISGKKSWWKYTEGEKGDTYSSCFPFFSLMSQRRKRYWLGWFWTFFRWVKSKSRTSDIKLFISLEPRVSVQVITNYSISSKLQLN